MIVCVGGQLISNVVIEKALIVCIVAGYGRLSCLFEH